MICYLLSLLPCKLYLVEEFIHKSGMRVETQWMCDWELEYYLRKGYISEKHIKLQYLSRYYMNGSNVSDYVDYLFENFEPSVANKLFHRFYFSL